ncbi:MAG: hypothetical protein Q9227_003371 [Pyrenula ochraceoflavens]
MSSSPWRLEKDYHQNPAKEDFRSNFTDIGQYIPDQERNKGRSLNSSQLSEEERKEFLESGADLEDSGWEGRRFLGKGGYGCAGLWQKGKGEVVENIVIKQQSLRKPIAHERWPGGGGLPNEMVHMFQLNKLDCKNILRIKDFKQYPHLGAERFYFEYCPYQELYTLRERYVAFA